MTKSALFKQAHALAKATVKAGDDYRVTFGLCLKAIIADSKAPKKEVKMTTPCTKKVKKVKVSLEYWKNEIADMPAFVDGAWVDLETGLAYADCQEVEVTRTRTEQKRIDRTVKARTTAKSLGAKALKGTAKQKAWAENIRKEFLEQDLTDDALMLVTSSEMTATAKFWIETRSISREALAAAMNDLVVATRTANIIGAGNAGYDEQLAIRAAALKVLNI